MAAEGQGGKTLDERIRLIEDRLDIYNLIASHPPSADTGAGDYTASVWTEDGVFDRGAEFPRPTGRAAIAGGPGGFQVRGGRATRGGSVPPGGGGKIRGRPWGPPDGWARAGEIWRGAFEP